MANTIIGVLHGLDEVVGALPPETAANIETQILDNLQARGFDIKSIAITISGTSVAVILGVAALSAGGALLAITAALGAAAVMIATLYTVYFTSATFFDENIAQIGATNELSRNYYIQEVLKNPNLSQAEKDQLIAEINARYDNLQANLPPPTTDDSIAGDPKTQALLIIGAAAVAGIAIAALT